MSNKTSRISAQGAKRKADDFRFIKGLSKTAKAKLHSVGILTFAQLAAMSPHEVVAAIGSSDEITAEHILGEDWIGQAGKLAAAVNVVAESDIKPPSQQLIPKPDERRTSFALELKLNEDNTVRQTRVMHVESEETDAEEKWPGWDETRLLGFIAHRGKFISVPSVETMPARLVQPLSTKLEVFTAKSGIPSGLVSGSEPYCVRVMLNSTEVKPLAASELTYNITVYARHLATNFEHKRYLVIGESEGVLATTDELVFTVNGAKLLQGAYRLHAAVRFNAVETESAPSRSVTTFVEGNLLQIY